MRYRLPAHSFEVTGHCLKCRDLFDLELERRQGDVFLSPTQTAVQQQDGRIVHRPGRCGGDIVLYG